VMGHLIECPKHNGQFDYRTGEAKRLPACADLRTFPVKVENGLVYVEVP
jgi:3-phenylpropionate/trans-cinnamate dioxygenase ferredoxin component